MTPLKPRVHFSKVDAERKELSSVNYNRPAAAFKPQQFSPPQQFTPPQQFSQPQQVSAPERSSAVFSPVSNPSPISSYSPSNLPLSPRSTRKVATPKFNAGGRTAAWTPGSANASQSFDASSLAKSLEQNGSAEREAPKPMRWTPGQPVKPVKVELPDAPCPSTMSLVDRNLNATYDAPSPPQPYQLSQKRNSLPNTSSYQQPYQSNQPSYQPPSPTQSQMHQFQQKAKQKTPPPTPTKPSKPWFPGMKASPDQFNARKTYNTQPPAPPKKTSFATTDLLRGPQAMTSKFQNGNQPPAEYVAVISFFLSILKLSSFS